jgi:hypothetical protein
VVLVWPSQSFEITQPHPFGWPTLPLRHRVTASVGKCMSSKGLSRRRLSWRRIGPAIRRKTPPAALPDPDPLRCPNTPKVRNTRFLVAEHFSSPVGAHEPRPPRRLFASLVAVLPAPCFTIFRLIVWPMRSSRGEADLRLIGLTRELRTRNLGYPGKVALFCSPCSLSCTGRSRSQKL